MFLLKNVLVNNLRGWGIGVIRKLKPLKRAKLFIQRYEICGLEFAGFLNCNAFEPLKSF